MKFKGYGIIEIRKGIRIKVDLDFIKYYKKLIDYYYSNTLRNQLPAYGAHISIILPDIHKVIDFCKVRKYSHKRVEFSYNPENIFKSPKNIWMNVECVVGDEIKKILKIKEKHFLGYHLTIVNFKFDECQ